MCVHSKLGKLFLKLSQEIQEKGIWGRVDGVSQDTQGRK